MKKKINIYPCHTNNMTQAMSEQEITIDGSQILFDKKYELQPVILVKRKDKKSTTSADER